MTTGPSVCVWCLIVAVYVRETLRERTCYTTHLFSRYSDLPPCPILLHVCVDFKCICTHLPQVITAVGSHVQMIRDDHWVTALPQAVIPVNFKAFQVDDQYHWQRCDVQLAFCSIVSCRDGSSSGCNENMKKKRR